MIRQECRSEARSPRTTTVFGPIAAKNGRTVADNLKGLADEARRLADQGWVVVDITSFDDIVLRIGRQNGLDEASTPQQIADYLMEHFTEPLMRSGCLHAVHFMPNWRESHGATREHQRALDLGLEVIEIRE